MGDAEVGVSERAITEVRPTLAFLPWCRLADELVAGPTRLVPYRRNRPDLPGIDRRPEADAVASVLAMYRDLHGEPVSRLTLVHLDGQPLLAPLDAEARATINDWVKLVAFAALAGRDLLEPSGYVNAAQFALRFQEIVLDAGGEMTHLRRDVRTKYGGVKDARQIDGLQIGVPEQAESLEPVRPDRPLLAAIGRLKQNSDVVTWERWMDALVYFVEANTDSQDAAGVPQRVDHLLLASSFEALFDTRSERYKAEALSEAIDTLLGSFLNLDSRIQLCKSPRYSDATKEAYGRQTHVARAWAKELYFIRNDYGHGRRAATRDVGWSRREHEILGAIAFPLFVRKLLADAGHLRLDSRHRGNLAALEQAMAAPYAEWAALFSEARREENLADMGRALREIEERRAGTSKHDDD